MGLYRGSRKENENYYLGLRVLGPMTKPSSAVIWAALTAVDDYALNPYIHSPKVTSAPKRALQRSQRFPKRGLCQVPRFRRVSPETSIRGLATPSGLSSGNAWLGAQVCRSSWGSRSVYLRNPTAGQKQLQL